MTMKIPRKKNSFYTATSSRNVPQEQSQIKKKKHKDPVPRSLREGTILAIDPGTEKLGWSVSHLYKSGNTTEREWLDCGTIYGSGKGCALIDGIANDVQEIEDTYQVDVLGIEDYEYREGRTRGIFAVPALISVLKSDWYRKTGKEPIMIFSSTWKTVVCGNGSANKYKVKQSLIKITGIKIVKAIEDIYKQQALKRKQDPQDCYDAIAIDLYIHMTVQRFIKEERFRIYEK